MARWTAFPYDSAAYVHAAPTLARHWARLQAGDAETLPADTRVLAAWALCHAGRFEDAFDAGLAAGGGGITVANQAQAFHANDLERAEARRLAMLMAVAKRAAAQAAAEPANPNAHYWMAYALGRHSQCISVAAALARGLEPKIKRALETTLALAPAHADAHVARGAFHAEVIDKLGEPAARDQGADAAIGLRLFEQALRLDPGSAIARVEYAKALVMLEGEKRLADAEALYAKAAACSALDATQRLDIEMAKAELST